MSWEWMIAAVLPWLLILACPAVMWWMMRGRGGGKCHEAGAAEPKEGQTAGNADALAREVATLKARLAAVEGSGTRREGEHARPEV
ncbi:MAG: DUF2933 domain-containing protein [Longimicrobiales bacterium]